MGAMAFPAAGTGEQQFAINLTADQRFTRAGRHVLALSPDGMQLVYVANQRLFMHSLRDLSTVAIDGTEKVDPSNPPSRLTARGSRLVERHPQENSLGVAAPFRSPTSRIRWACHGRVTRLWSASRGRSSRCRPKAPAEDAGHRRTGAGDWLQSPQLIDEGRAVLFYAADRTSATGTARTSSFRIWRAGRERCGAGRTDGHVLPGPC
jgi:hypothetical protein